MKKLILFAVIIIGCQKEVEVKPVIINPDVECDAPNQGASPGYGLLRIENSKTDTTFNLKFVFFNSKTSYYADYYFYRYRYNCDWRSKGLVIHK